ncbi:MAG TPA: serine/threonine-protein kinase [Polyangiaceae bacterium]|nr:serine/threonine-protein kinase [Polyangiaceae bacterium]
MDVAQGTLPAGFEFGAYVIGGCIGQGGMARIYRAEHRVLHKPVALKVLESVLLERPDGRPRFLREGQAAAAVKHPNVVDITDVGVWQGRPYLVMELLEGEDLERYLGRRKPLAEEDIARIMIPVVAGLVTAHAAGVIHRDLKPSNVFLSHGPDGELVPKLLDFGISKLHGPLRAFDPSSTPLGELMGSPMYMSPEAVRGSRDLTPQSDQYSLGVILYECVTGRPPFYGDSLLSVLEAVAHGDFESPRRHRPGLSTVLEVAILRAMSREPEDRFPSVRELGRALCEAADQRTRLLWTPSFGLREPPLRSTASLGAPPIRAGSPPGARRGGSRARLWSLGLAALALVFLALAIVAYWRVPWTPYARVPARPPAAAAGAAPLVPLPPAAVAARPDAPMTVIAAARPPAPARERADVGEASAQSTTRPAARTPPAAGAVRAQPARRAAEATGSRASSSAAQASAARAADDAPPPAREAADDEIVFPTRTPPRPTAVLGANQSPILD